MADQFEMISPFEPAQIRVGEDNRKLISYGTSSYGYDVRCSNEFKVFTNINSATVDPKKFDEKSFVDIKMTCASFLQIRLHSQVLLSILKSLEMS